MLYNSNMIKNIQILDAYCFLLELYNIIADGKLMPIRSIKMLSARFSGKTYQVEHFIALLMLQKKRKVTINYVRARGDETLKALKTIQTLIGLFTKGIARTKSMQATKQIWLNGNVANFIVLNEIKDKATKTGGKIGANIAYETEYTITFFEECSQLDKDLVQNFSQSVKSSLMDDINITTENDLDGRQLFIYASNPWVKSHWFVEEFIEKLPETNPMEYELNQRGYNSYFDEETKTLFFRPRHTLNPFIPPSTKKEIAMMKNVNYNKWRIVSLGFSGSLEKSIYQASLMKLNQKVNYNLFTPMYGGVDWGDGKSSKASPSTAYISNIDQVHGVNVLEEFTHWNNRGASLTTDQQISQICDFYIKWYNKKGIPITVFIDDASLKGFETMFQTMLRTKGYFAQQIEFLPAFKPKNTWERVETLNVMLALGILRFEKSVCPELYKALENCYEVVKQNPSENSRRERSHEYTHWIHALEYMIAAHFKVFQDMFPILTHTKYIGNNL